MIKALIAAPLAYAVLLVVANRSWENKATGPAARTGFNPWNLLRRIVAHYFPGPTPPEHRGETITDLTALVDGQDRRL